MLTSVSLLAHPGIHAIARKVHESNSNDAIVARLRNPFGDILVFTDSDARDAYESHVNPFVLKGDDMYPMEMDDAVVLIPISWGQKT